MLVSLPLRFSPDEAKALVFLAFDKTKTKNPKNSLLDRVNFSFHFDNPKTNDCI
jgi:hypothetical protein